MRSISIAGVMLMCLLAVTACTKAKDPAIPPESAGSPSPSPGTSAAATIEPIPLWYTVDCEAYLPLRAGPSPDEDKIGRADKGARVQLLGLSERFAKIQLPDGLEGYVLAGYLTPEEPDGVLRGANIVQPTAAYSYDRMREDMAALEAKYPDALAVEIIGTSGEGRDILAAAVGNPAAPVHILVQAAIHGREHMTSLLVMAQLERLLQQGVDEGIRVHILPMSNPDGVTISQRGRGGKAQEAVYARDAQQGFASGLTVSGYFEEWKANAGGVDLNRNFPAGFANINSRPEPSSEGYRGDYAASEPETQALMDYTKRYAFAATLSYHAMGSELYYDFGPNSPANEAGARLGLAIQEVSGYPPVPDSGTSFGGYKDWAIETMSIPSLTIEVGSRSCPLPLREFDMVWLRNRNVLVAAMKWVYTEEGIV